MAYRKSESEERRLERRRLAVISSATAIVASRGWDAATVEAVAKSAHMAKGNVYIYFPTIDELHAAVALTAREADVQIMAMAGMQRPYGVPRLAASLGALYTRFERTKLATALMQHKVYRLGILDTVSLLVGEAVSSLPADPEIVAGAVVGVLYGAACYPGRPRGDVSTVVSMALRAIGLSDAVARRWGANVNA